MSVILGYPPRGVRKPIIGIIGGIGSGKSFIASLFGELGPMVINADDLVHQVYRRPEVQAQLKQWWGDGVIQPDGMINRRAIAARIFTDDAERKRLEDLLHPLVAAERIQLMKQSAADLRVNAYVWDVPLLVETGLHTQCDAVVFVDTPREIRLERVRGRGWDEAELLRREKLQLPLDTKREISDYVLSNAADADTARGQVRQVFSRIKAKIAADLTDSA